jgi:hypothetical protein
MQSISRVLSTKLPWMLHHLTNATYPPGPDEPPSDKHFRAHTPGLHGLTAHKVYQGRRCYQRRRWSLTPPFHNRQLSLRHSKFLQHYLSTKICILAAHAFHMVWCPALPGLSSLSQVQSDEAIAFFCENTSRPQWLNDFKKNQDLIKPFPKLQP